MNKYVIIAAGGSGSRMQSELPKQFLLLNNKPILCHAIEKFIQAFDDIRIIIAVPLQFMEHTKEVLQQNNLEKNATVIEGGPTRFHSVQNGINQIEDDKAIVFVHDAARCLVSVALIENCYAAAVQYGNAIPAINSADSLRLIVDDGNEVLDRTKVKIIQTPQTFVVDSLKKAFAQDYMPQFTDEASVVEQLGITIHLIDGEVNNLKITTPLDFQLASLLLT